MNLGVVEGLYHLGLNWLEKVPKDIFPIFNGDFAL